MTEASSGNQAADHLERAFQEHLEKREFEPALGKIRALQLVGRGDAELEDALTRVIEILEALRAKNYAGAKKVPLNNWERLGVDALGIPQALSALEDAEANWRNGEPKVRSALEIARAHWLTKAEAENQLGVLEAIIERWDVARGHFQAALSSDPKHHRALTNLGNLELETGHLEAAEARYREVIRINPEYSVVYNNLAAVLRKLGKRGESVEMIKKSQRLAMREIRGQAKGTTVGRPKTGLTNWFNNPNSRWVILIAVVIIVFLLTRR
jgi:tetratricopeptide (TPR) repeat protein